MPSRRAAAAYLAALLVWGACAREASGPAGPPDFTLVDPLVWGGGALRLTAPGLASITALQVAVDDSVVDTARIRRAGPDTILVRMGQLSENNQLVPPGPHAVSIGTGGGWSTAQLFEVGGYSGQDYFAPTAVPLVTRPLAVGGGSSQFWVGTARGLALLDARFPSLAPQLVDSTVDPSCLASIGSSVNGAVVVADQACGTLRARSYRPGSALVEIDSGPPARCAPVPPYYSCWLYALNYPPGVWLLAKRDTIALAVRAAGGGWTWTRWAFAQSEPDLVPSPDGRLAVAEVPYPGGPQPQVVVFDLEHGALLYQNASVGPAAVFSPSGDTLVALGFTSVVLLDSRTGNRLAVVATHPSDLGTLDRYVGYMIGLFWDPDGPWLYGLKFDYGCPAYVVMDRRTWTVVGHDGDGDCNWEGVIAVSAGQHGWILTGDGFSLGSHNWINRFAIPGP